MGNCHRDSGLPSVIYANGDCAWYTYGEKVGDSARPPPDAVFPGQLTKAARAL